MSFAWTCWAATVICGGLTAFVDENFLEIGGLRVSIHQVSWYAQLRWLFKLASVCVSVKRSGYSHSLCG